LDLFHYYRPLGVKKIRPYVKPTSFICQDICWLSDILCGIYWNPCRGCRRKLSGALGFCQHRLSDNHT